MAFTAEFKKTPKATPNIQNPNNKHTYSESGCEAHTSEKDTERETPSSYISPLEYYIPSAAASADSDGEVQKEHKESCSSCAGCALQNSDLTAATTFTLTVSAAFLNCQCHACEMVIAALGDTDTAF